MSQDRIFLEEEGDAWFKRNRAALENEGSADWPLRVLDLLGDIEGLLDVAELGCANGYRLHRMPEKFPQARRFAGVDASITAIADGRARYPQLELVQGTLAEIPLQGQFGLVIVNFVLHWVDRETLARSVAEIDRLTRDGGTLILGDFLPDYPQRRRYHHYQHAEVFTYKQDYARIFEALGTYKELLRVSFNHDRPDTAACDTDSRGACAALRKSLSGYYSERT